MELQDFPTYQYKLTSMERTCMANIGWAWSTVDPIKFDEDFNHKACDELNIPRTINRPIDFCI